MGTASANSPLLARTTHDQHEEDEEEWEQGDYKSASAATAVFSLSTSIVGIGIMALPATMRIGGVVPAFVFIVLCAFFTNASLDFLLKYSKAAKAATYAGVMEDAFGPFGRVILQATIVVSSFGALVVYLIIMADVLSGSTSGSVHHSGVLEEWAGSCTWWNTRSAVMVFTTVFILGPLVSFRRIDSLKLSSTLSVALAILFVIVTAVVAIWKLIDGEIGWPRMFPDFKDTTTIYECFTMIPVIVVSFICHHCVHPVLNELEKSSSPQTVVRTSLVLCTTIYLATGLFGFLLFGDDTSSDVLSNFDVDLGVPYSAVITDLVRVGYVIHLMLVFPLLHFAFRLNLDGLMFPEAAALSHDTPRFFLLTASSMTLSLLIAIFAPSIWVVSQIVGSTTVIVMCFIFPPSIVLRDVHGISTRGERWAAWFMIVVAVASSLISLTANILDIF